MRNKFSGLFLLATILLVVLFTTQCARMAAPTGGEKDVEAPYALRSKPVNYSTRFSGSKFIVEFNEFIVLKNINQELLVSPPLPEKPIIKQRGKLLIVKINNQLKDSTTYNYNFYNAISDLNEGNELKNFQFEFSTGTQFDSIYLGGTVQNAFDYRTEEGVLVMLYNQLNDSTPRKMIPEHIGKTDKEGLFIVPNMRPQPYFIFALKDMNNNMKFDLPNESIAFSDSTFEPGFQEVEFTDTFKVISQISKDNNDTIYRDSLYRHNEIVTTIGNLRLFMFTEDFGQQYFKNWYRPEKQQVILSFNRKLTDSISIIPLSNEVFNPNWMLMESEIKTDSLIFWITDTSLYKKDSLSFQLNYTMKDSNQNNYTRTDTLMVIFQPKEKKSKEAKPAKKIGGMFNNLFNNKETTEIKDSIKVPSQLTINHNIKNPFELNTSIKLTMRFPIKEVKAAEIKLVKIDEKDTIKQKVTLRKDAKSLRDYYLDFTSDEETKYNLLIPEGCFIDQYNQTNDTLKLDFTTRPLDFYSNLKMNVINVKAYSIIQLLDEKENVIEERPIYSDTILNYTYLSPQKYIFKLFYDTNHNGFWDTGNFSKRLQPEQVFYFDQEIKSKSNWDMNFTWDLYPVNPTFKKPTEDKTKTKKK